MSWVQTSNVISQWDNIQVLIDRDGEFNVPAKQFLDAVHTLSSMFDLLPGVSLAKIAMMDHITKIRAHLKADRPNLTLRDMVEEELKHKTHKDVFADQKSVCHQLTWLTRAIGFLNGIVQELQSDAAKEMNAAVSASYATSLRPHHGFVVRNTVLVAAKAAPSRATFMKRLDEHDPDVLSTLKATIETVACMNKANGTLVERFASS